MRSCLIYKESPRQKIKHFSGRQNTAASSLITRTSYNSPFSPSLLAICEPLSSMFLQMLIWIWFEKFEVGGIWEEVYNFNCPRPCSTRGWLCLPQQVEGLIQPNGKFGSLEKLASRDSEKVQISLSSWIQFKKWPRHLGMTSAFFIEPKIVL